MCALTFIDAKIKGAKIALRTSFRAAILKGFDSMPFQFSTQSPVGFYAGIDAVTVDLVN